MQPSRYVIRTKRLKLIAGDATTVQAEISDRKLLSQLLEAVVPPDWPPDLNDLHMKELSLQWFKDHPAGQGWLCWYFISTEEEQPTLVGIGGFSDVPDITGSVEIGYSLLTRYRGRGYATEAVNGLVNWACRQPDVRRVRAEIYPGFEASERVLLKNGFRKCRPEVPDGIIHYEYIR